MDGAALKKMAAYRAELDAERENTLAVGLNKATHGKSPQITSVWAQENKEIRCRGGHPPRITWGRLGTREVDTKTAWCAWSYRWRHYKKCSDEIATCQRAAPALPLMIKPWSSKDFFHRPLVFCCR